MSKPEDLESIARSFVDGVLEAQRRRGLAVGVPHDDYQRAVERAATAFARLTERRETSDEEEAVAV